MSEENEFEKGIQSILNADDNLSKKDDLPSTKKVKEFNKSVEKTKANQIIKKYPGWITFVIRAIAGITFILLLLKYATNIAYR